MENTIQYNNGNYQVYLFDDGSKIRHTYDNQLIPDFPESVDMKITNQCFNQCPFCYQQSSPNGNHANLANELLYTMKSGSELAIGGGNPLLHPKIESFLTSQSYNGVICNMTLHQKDFMDNLKKIESFIDEELLHGIGISVNNPSDNLIKIIKKFDNAVVHVINEITPISVIKKLADNDLKLLILGKKPSTPSLDEDITGDSFYNILDRIHNGFKIVSYDNLAIQQLDPNRFIEHSVFKHLYQGDEGEFSMYIDAIENKYAKSSIEEKMIDIKNEETITELFKKL